MKSEIFNLEHLMSAGNEDVFFLKNLKDKVMCI